MIRKFNDLPYPKNLVASLYGDVFTSYPEDFEASVQYVLYCLDERERLALEYKYRDGMTFKEIGIKLNNITGDNVRSMLETIERKLRSPKRFRFIMYGVKKELENRMELFKCSSERELSKLNTSVQAKRTLTIDNLNLNTASFNCLGRACWQFNKDRYLDITIGDVIDYINENKTLTKHIRNCGAKHQKEIIKAICDIGLRDELTIDVDKILGG